VKNCRTSDIELLVITLFSRYLVITRDRFIVLDSRGEGVGAEAIVKSNNHLTELNKVHSFFNAELSECY